jgi:hypothetical protein
MGGPSMLMRTRDERIRDDVSLSRNNFFAFLISAKAPGESFLLCVRACIWLLDEEPKSIIYGRLCKLIFRPLC